jgi:hypothetical protein
MHYAPNKSQERMLTRLHALAGGILCKLHIAASLAAVAYNL